MLNYIKNIILKLIHLHMVSQISVYLGFELINKLIHFINIYYLFVVFNLLKY